MTASVLKMSGRVGCPECYQFFQHEILDYLNTPMMGAGEPEIRGESYIDLVIQLQKAVEKEDYEEAALLRDRIHALKEQSI
jgi:protein-arginine kinase activator protein McsA